MIGTNWLSDLKKFDRERFDSLRYLNSERRKEIAAIYSFNLELANIAWNVSEPGVGKVQSTKLLNGRDFLFGGGRLI